MRLWSIHPKYLDTKGLVALWREALLAQSVLLNNTKGYRSHPQLIRFKTSVDPLAAIGTYLETVYSESLLRGYNFNQSKINKRRTRILIEVTKGQMNYETQHLLHKLQTRDTAAFEFLKSSGFPEPHPLFSVVEGEIESWEIVKKYKKLIERVLTCRQLK